jgi:uncharacterized protein YkwD
MLRLLACSFALLILTAAAAGPTAAQGKKDPPKDQKQGEAKVELSRDEQTLLDLTNKERAKAKLSPLKPNPVLFQVAAAHSANMAKKNQMNHVLDGKNPAERALAGGYDYKHLGENLGESDGAPLRVIMQGWMNSKHHRDNILKPEFTEIGLGTARSGRGIIYYTQLFGTPKKKPNAEAPKPDAPAKEGNKPR